MWRKCGCSTPIVRTMTSYMMQYGTVLIGNETNNQCKHRSSAQDCQGDLQIGSCDPMFSNQSAELSLDVPSRTLEAVPSESSESSWMTASCALGGFNRLRRIQFHSDSNELSVAAEYEVEEPVRCLASLDSTRVVLATEQGSSAQVLRLEQETTMPEPASTLLPESGFGANLVQLAYNRPMEQLLLLDSTGHLSQWDMLSASCLQAVDTDTAAQQTPFRSVAWDPHSDGTAVAVSAAKTVSFLDWRVDTSVPTGIAPSLTSAVSNITTVDYNPNKPHVLLTGLNNGMVKFWDLRRNRRPLLTLTGGHSFGVRVASFNPCHDALCLTSGANTTNLWLVHSVSSAPLTYSKNQRAVQHSMSSDVACATWSSSDAWMYLTMAWDGKMELHHVPSREKYKILL